MLLIGGGKIKCQALRIIYLVKRTSQIAFFGYVGGRYIDGVGCTVEDVVKFHRLLLCNGTLGKIDMRITRLWRGDPLLIVEIRPYFIC